MSGMRSFRSVFASVIFVALTAGPAFADGPSTITALAIDSLDPIALYAGTYGGGVFKSTDGGASWSPTSLTNVFVWSMAIAPRASPADPTTVYAVASGGVFKSTDGGASWSPTSLTNVNVLSIAIDPLTPTTLYAGAPGGVFKSTDRGTNWIGILSSISSYEGVSAGVMSLSIDPLTPTTLFAGTAAITGTFDDGEIWSIGGGVFRSVDGGTSWGAVLGAQLQFYGGPYDSVLALAIAPRTDPSTPATLYAGRGDVGLFKSEDGGTNWSPTGVQSSVGSLAIDPLTPTTLYAGYFKTTDGGVTWNRIGLTGVDLLAMAIDPVTPTTLYAGTSGGVYKSVDGAENWNPTGPITWLHLSSVNLNPTSVIGGNASTGTVTLSAPAPISGAAVALSSSDTAVATVPTSVTVTAGATSANFVVSTSAVTASTEAAIYATYGGVVGSGLTVTPATTLSSLSLNPASVAPTR